jgi:ribose transport system ATP-binding protein
VKILDNEILLSMQNISKKFPGTQALDDVSFKVKKGEVHAVVGENGAGKSTLVNIIAGVVHKDLGHLIFNGKEVNIQNVQQAQRVGIKVVFQELSLVPNLSVAENIYGSSNNMESFQIMNLNNIDERAKDLIQKFNINPKKIVKELGIAEQQIVEIAGALVNDCSLIIFDEPSASFTVSEIDILFDIIKLLKKNGLTVIYISHKIEEIIQICDRVTILKDGKYVNTKEIKNTNQREIVNLMVGRELKNMFPERGKSERKLLLSVKNFSGEKFKNISFELYSGEILGFTGLTGAGRTELFRAIFGVDQPQSGEIKIKGKKVNLNNPYKSMKNGIGFLPEDRKQDGVFLDMDIKDNIIVANLKANSNKITMNRKKSEKNAIDMVKKIDIKIGNIYDKAISLSGGNQQKLLIARWLLANSQILIVDEPTRGIDVGAKQEVYFVLRDLANHGIGIIFISSELPEILGLSDRVIAMYHGKITGDLPIEGITEEKIGELIMGL